MQDTPELTQSASAVLGRFSFLPTPRRTIPFGAAPAESGRLGFSGARIWQVETPTGRYCLRRWPAEHPGRERLEFIHQVLQHASAHGIGVLPVPLLDRSGHSIISFDEHLWELTPWLPGAADFERDPTPSRLAAAMATLAQFHRAAADFLPPRQAPSSTVADRLEWAERLARGELQTLTAAIRPGDWPHLAELARRFLDPASQLLPLILARLQRAQSVLLPMQPCIRDIWHDHILFTGDKVTGIVDFGAMRVDTVACDVARLRGSLAGDDPARRVAALVAYESVRPLAATERELVDLLDDSGVLLGGLNWLRWVYLEQRSFEDRLRVEQRLEALLQRALHALRTQFIR